MTSTRWIRWKAAGVTLAASIVAFSSGPARASNSTYAVDSIGADYDAACGARTGPPPPPNSITTSGCPGISTYDGSMTSVDLAPVPSPPKCNPTAPSTFWSLCLASRGDGKLGGYLNVAAPSFPAPGSTGPFDLPSGAFTGATYYNLFQNALVQTNVPTNPSGGCTKVGVGGPIYDQHGSWKDGYQLFEAFGVHRTITGAWEWMLSVGEYDPGTGGGFRHHALGVADHTDTSGDPVWRNTSDLMKYGVDWTAEVSSGGGFTTIGMTFDPTVKIRNPACVGGVFNMVFAQPGDEILNNSGMTTADVGITLTTEAPPGPSCGLTGGLVCVDDHTLIGYYDYVVDVTDGNSIPGLLDTNISGISYTPGPFGAVDTLGDGPTCPTPTFGGLLPTNPLFTPDTACQIDDDSTARGSFLSEFWDTPHGFTV
jgi:hypothetical protein